jgi:hypothetical protein
MNKVSYFFLGIWMIFTTCSTIPKQGMGIKNLRYISKELKRISNGRYYFDNSLIHDRYFFLRPVATTTVYTQMPVLPYGFYLYYKDGEAFPRLECLQFSSNLAKLAYFLIKEIYVYDDALVFSVLNQDRFIKIDFSDIYTGLEVSEPPPGFKVCYIFQELDEKYRASFHFVSYAFDLQDKHIDINHSILIRGIISGGIVYRNQEPYLTGETIYCPFSFSIKDGTIAYYKNFEEFDVFLKTIDEPDNISIPRFTYDERTEERKAGKELELFYTEIYGERMRQNGTP